MKLFLSSWDPQGFPPELRSIVGENTRCALIVNACDAYDVDGRAEVRDRTMAGLRAAGFDPTELDLRELTDDEAAIEAALGPCGLVWVTGGNAFVLRSVMRRSGFEGCARRLLESTDLTYGASSAGAIVAGASLRGVELVDPVRDLDRAGGGEPIWEGLGFVDFTIAPHYESIGPLRDEVAALVRELQNSRVPYRALRDGQSLAFDGARAYLVDHAREAKRFALERSGEIDNKHNRN